MSLKDIPHYVLYPAIGFFLGLGSPIGAFLMRYWLADPILKSAWARSELQYNLIFYVYMAAGTIIAFMVSGYAIGVSSERQRVSNRMLKARISDLHLKSVTDSLTGTYTHGYLHEALEIEFQKASVNKTPLSVLMLDIDDFKRVNDSHGHLFGDRAIKETAETVSANVRSEDILGRMGGDEFLVIMPGADRGTALHVAGRICSSIAQSGFNMTVSIGAATASAGKESSIKDLLHAADANLYKAKRAGKNQVSLSDEPQPA